MTKNPHCRKQGTEESELKRERTCPTCHSSASAVRPARSWLSEVSLRVLPDLIWSCLTDGAQPQPAERSPPAGLGFGFHRGHVIPDHLDLPRNVVVRKNMFPYLPNTKEPWETPYLVRF